MMVTLLSVPVLGLDKEERAAVKAIEAGNIELLLSYLEKHPDINCEFSNGKTGLYYAIVYDRFTIAEFLLKRGSDPDFEAGGFSTLGWAVQYSRGRLARLLIEYGADVEKPVDKHNTPLMYAAGLYNMEICKILIDRGADPLQSNKEGERASDFAGHYAGSTAYQYLLFMEKQCQGRDTVPSMKDGPYIEWETDSRIVITYFEHDHDKKRTRLIEKTVELGPGDTVVSGYEWDKGIYHIKHTYPPEPYEVKTTGNLFVIGDVHGKYNAMVNLLINNKIIDPDLNWIFGDGQLVLLGDVFDRGDRVTEVLWFLYELQIKARHSGGNVNLLLGNHEIMALTGDHRYLNYKYNYFSEYTQVYYYTLFDNNSVLGRWLRSQNIIDRINDNLFLHAGISPQFAIHDYNYSDINARVQNYLISGNRKEKGSPEDFILGSLGPQWYRGYQSHNENFPEMTQEFVDTYLEVHGLKRMIVGHNEQESINTSYEGKIISADVEIDESGITSQGLLISGDQIFRCLSDGTKEPIL
jgi:hypothetical protein